MATSPEVKIKISGDPRGADAAVKNIQGALKRLSGDLTKVQQISARVLSVAGLVAGPIAALVALAKNAADAADRMGNLADATGVSVRELSTLAYAADLSGTNVDELAQGMRKLAQDAARGGDNLKAAGVGLLDAGGKARTADQLFKAVAQRFAELPPGVDKTALAIRLFGDELGPKLVPLLNQGTAGLERMQKEAERLGLAISERAKEAAVEFNDNLTRLQGLARGVGVEIGNSLIPALNELANEFLDAREAGLTWFQALSGIGLSNPFKTAAQQVERLTAEIDALREAQARAPSSPEEVGVFDVDKQIEELERLRKYYQLQAGRTRTEEQIAQEAQARKLLETQTKLQNEIAKLASLREQKSKQAAAEELKGAERLRDALRSAWQTSVDGAASATAAAKKLLEDSDKARKDGNQKADDRLKRDVPPEIKSQDAFREAEQLRSQANTKAQEAIIQGINGNTQGAIKLAGDALEMANRAEKLTEDIQDNNLAGGLLRQLGEIRADILKAESYIKKGEAKDADKLATQQQQELTKVEDRITTLKQLLEEPVKIDADITAAENTIKTLRAQLDEIKDKTVTVTVNTVNTAGTSASAPSTGFARGGFTGPGGKYQPAGIVHAGEFVLRQEVVRQAGMRRMLERLNRYGADALQGYADGGFVRGPAPTPINIKWPDGSVSKVSAPRDEADALLRAVTRASLKAGGRR